MTPKELRGKKEKDWTTLEAKWRQELSLLKLQASVGQCPNTSQIGILKKNIARLKTIISIQFTDMNAAGLGCIVVKANLR